MLSVVTIIAAGAEKHFPLFAPTWVFGVGPLVIFAVLAVVLWTYRNVANRHIHKAEANAAGHAQSAGATTHGAGHPHPAEDPIH